jgi:hypothetical protein
MSVERHDLTVELTSDNLALSRNWLILKKRGNSISTSTKQAPKGAALEKIRQEKFCQLYVSAEFFGNGVQSYVEAYQFDQSKPNWYKTAAAAASRLLTNVKVCARINELLDETGLNDAFVDKQLLFLITQHDDFSSKIQAIREFNKLKGRITELHKFKGGFFNAEKITIEIVNGPEAQPDPESGADAPQ